MAASLLPHPVDAPADHPLDAHEVPAPLADPPGCRFCGRRAAHHGVHLLHRFVRSDPPGWGHLLEPRLAWSAPEDDAA